MGAVIEENGLTKKATHVLAINLEALVEKFGKQLLSGFRGVSWVFFSFHLCFSFCATKHRQKSNVLYLLCVLMSCLGN